MTEIQKPDILFVASEPDSFPRQQVLGEYKVLIRHFGAQRVHPLLNPTEADLVEVRGTWSVVHVAGTCLAEGFATVDPPPSSGPSSAPEGNIVSFDEFLSADSGCHARLKIITGITFASPPRLDGCDVSIVLHGEPITLDDVRLGVHSIYAILAPIVSNSPGEDPDISLGQILAKSDRPLLPPRLRSLFLIVRTDRGT